MSSRSTGTGGAPGMVPEGYARKAPGAPQAPGEFVAEPRSAPGPSSSQYSQVRAYVQYRAAVAREISRASAASSTDSPAKYRRVTSLAFTGSSAANLVRASSRATRSAARDGAMASTSSRSIRRRSPPCFSVSFRRALSIRMRRMASAAAARKCPRPAKYWSPTRRRYASWTRAVACSVWPGCSWASLAAASRLSSVYTSGSRSAAACSSPRCAASSKRLTSDMAARVPDPPAAVTPINAGPGPQRVLDFGDPRPRKRRDPPQPRPQGPHCPHSPGHRGRCPLARGGGSDHQRDKGQLYLRGGQVPARWVRDEDHRDHVHNRHDRDVNPPLTPDRPWTRSRSPSRSA